MASQVSPIEATRYLEWSGGEKSSQKLHRSLTPARLALMNFSRNKKKSILTVVSLAVSGILLLCVSTFSYSYNAEVDARNDFPYGDFQITIKDSGDLSAGSNDEWNYSRLKIKNPLNASLREKMLQIDGVAGIQDETAIHVQFTLPDGTALSGAIKGFNAKDSVAMQSKVIAGTLDYQTLCEKNGIAIAKCKIKNYTPQLGDKISLQYLKADGTTSMQDFTVMAILSDYQNPFGLPIALPTDTMNTLSGFDHIDTYYVKTSPDKEKNVQAALNKIIAVNNNLELNTFKEAVDYKKSLMEPQIVIFYGLSLIVIIFGLINLLNTTITNFISRQREIGILQAIGLTGKQLNFMFWTEGICYTAGASALTLIFGTLLGYAGFWILLPIKNYYQYRFPVIPALEFIGIMLIMQIVISVFTVCNMKKQSLVERIEQRT
jgi:putative ABC transport system permease protein